METSRVLISSSSASWNDGCGRLYTELFAAQEHNDDYAILHIAGPQDIPHARPGFYFLTAALVAVAETSGIILTDSEGDRFGFLLPGEPATSLEAAACARGSFPLSHDLLQSEADQQKPDLAQAVHGAQVSIEVLLQHLRILRIPYPGLQGNSLFLLLEESLIEAQQAAGGLTDYACHADLAEFERPSSAGEK